MGVCGDGAQVCASVDRAPSRVRGPHEWSKWPAGGGVIGRMGWSSVATFWLHTHKRKRVASLQPVEESGAPGRI